MLVAERPTTRLTRQLHPLTERILAALPGQQPLWIVLWMLLPSLNAGANLLLDTESRSAVWEQSRVLVFLNYAALTLGILIALWGTRRIARRLDALRRPTSTLLELDSAEPFREMNNIRGPLLMSAAAATAFAASAAYNGSADCSGRRTRSRNGRRTSTNGLSTKGLSLAS